MRSAGAFDVLAVAHGVLHRAGAQAVAQQVDEALHRMHRGAQVVRDRRGEVVQQRLGL